MQITQKQETINSTTSTYDYVYDDNSRLTEVKKDNTIVESYSYDKNGNRLSSSVKGITNTGSYTLDDQLEVYGNNTYRYDEDGYLSEKTTPDGVTTYSYSTVGELKEVVTPSKTITYKHNSSNQRVTKLINNVIVEKYLWANLTTLLAIYDKDDNLVQRFEYANSRMPISMSFNTSKYYLHNDQIGSLRAVSDSNHNIIKEITYDTYGNILSDSNTSFKVPFGFAGGLYDEDTKLVRFGYRDYDSYTGKWTAKDPIDFGGGDSNLYGYVLGNPVNGIDPLGLWIPQLIGAGINIGFEVYHNGWSWNGVAVAGITGALGGFNIFTATLANGLNNIYQQTRNNCEEFDGKQLSQSLALGWIGGQAGNFLGQVGSNVRRGYVLGNPARGNYDYSTEGSAIGALVGGGIGNY